MTIGKLYDTIKGVANLKLIRLSDSALLHLPTPTGFVIDNGIEEKIQITQNNQGEMTRSGSYITGRMPVLRVVYSYMQPEILQFKIGNQFDAKTGTLDVVKSYQVTQNNYAAVTTGFLGYGVALNAPSKASVQRDNLSVQLTQVSIASFDATTDDTFAVGASLNVKFSNNLVTANETVSLTTTEAFTGTGISDNVVGAHKVSALLITKANKVIHFKCDNVTPSYSGSTIDPKADAIEIPFFINDVPGVCFPYEWNYVPIQVGCN
jgi:hypothetical protein